MQTIPISLGVSRDGTQPEVGTGPYSPPEPHHPIQPFQNLPTFLFFASNAVDCDCGPLCVSSMRLSNFLTRFEYHFFFKLLFRGEKKKRKKNRIHLPLPRNDTSFLMIFFSSFLSFFFLIFGFELIKFWLLAGFLFFYFFTFHFEI